MSYRSARWIFHLEALVSVVLLLVLTSETRGQIQSLNSADELTDEVIVGSQVWQKYHCNDCHTILGLGTHYAPDLTKVYWQRGSEAIKAMIRTPERFTGWPKMPRLSLSEKELDDLVAFLKWTGETDKEQSLSKESVASPVKG